VKSSQNIVGPKVRQLRVSQDLSQEQLATRLQVAGWDLSRAGLSKIEAGLRRVTDAELVVLARALGCAPAKLIPDDLGHLPDVLRQGR